jgi:cell division transport system permease protein
LLPKEDAREAALFFVVCALCFLAALSGLVARAA